MIAIVLQVQSILRYIIHLFITLYNAFLHIALYKCYNLFCEIQLQFSSAKFKLLSESYNFLHVTLTSFDSKKIKIDMKGI